MWYQERQKFNLCMFLMRHCAALGFYGLSEQSLYNKEWRANGILFIKQLMNSMETFPLSFMALRSRFLHVNIRFVFEGITAAISVYKIKPIYK